MNYIKTILVLLFITLLPITTQSKPTYVWVCLSSGAYSYHYKENCGYLQKCSKKIKKVKLEEAIEWGRKPCKGCTK